MYVDALGPSEESEGIPTSRNMALDHPRWAGLPNHLPYPSGRAERPRTCQPRASRAKQRMAGRLCHLGMIFFSVPMGWNLMEKDGKGWKRRFIPPETPFEVSHAGNLTHVFFGAFWIFLGSHGEPIFRQTPFRLSHSLESHKCAGNWGECIIYIIFRRNHIQVIGAPKGPQKPGHFMWGSVKC